MSARAPDELKKTPLNATHRASGARMVGFGGWDMPVEYSGISAEHMAVRTRAGLFDVSHMGQVEIAGAEARALLQQITCNDVSKLAIGQVQYSAITTNAGTFVDDVLVYRLATDHYMVVVNASNIAKDVAWIQAAAAAHGGDLAVVNASSRYALLAVQGPASADVLGSLTSVALDSVKYYWFATGEVASVRATVSRTGYTGEDGFELFVPPAQAAKVWQAVLEAGRHVDLLPCGLGARDTLRLEASMRLCGADMDETTSVLEAGLGWIVGWQKAAFAGLDHLRAERAQGPSRQLVGFEMLDRAIARHGYAVLRNGSPCGQVTSGTHTPFLKKAIGLALVPAALAAVGTELDIDVRGRHSRAVVVKEPFYRRPRPPRAV